MAEPVHVPGPFEQQATRLKSPFGVEDCVRRLSAAIDSDTIPFGTRPVRGWAMAGKAVLRRNSLLRNDFKPVLKINVEPLDTGSRLTCRFGPPVLAMLFLGAVLSVCLFMFVQAVVTTIAHLIDGTASWAQGGTLLQFAAMSVATGAALGFLPRLFGSDQAFLLDFVTRTLDATRLPDPQAGPLSFPQPRPVVE